MSVGNPFENYFSEFVMLVGGDVIDKSNAAESEVEPADYYFPEHDIFISLSPFLQDDSTRTDTMMLEAILEWGGDIGTIPISYDVDGQPFVSQDSLPDDIKAIWVEKLTNEIEQAVSNASEQIAASKEVFKKPDAHGIILVANASKLYYNYPSAYSRALFAAVLRTDESGEREYPEIEGGVCFAVKSLEHNPNIPSWAPFHIEGPDGTTAEIHEFLSQLHRDWNAYTETIRHMALTDQARG